MTPRGRQHPSGENKGWDCAYRVHTGVDLAQQTACMAFLKFPLENPGALGRENTSKNSPYTKMLREVCCTQDGRTSRTPTTAPPLMAQGPEKPLLTALGQEEPWLGRLALNGTL